MQLAETQIKRFQELYKARFGVDISAQEATEKGLRLVELVRLIYAPNPLKTSK